MLGRIMDWFDWFTGYDRTGVRVLFFVLAINLAFLAYVTYGWLKPDPCDADCQAGVEKFIDDNPALFEPMPTIDVERLIGTVTAPAPQ